MSLRADAHTYRVTLTDRMTARLSGPMRRRLSMAHDPAWPIVGDAGQGRALLEGRFGLGEAMSRPGQSIWDITPDSADAEIARQNFGWLDHLSADGSGSAHRMACNWVSEWMNRFGHGKGPGWHLVSVAARLDRLTRQAGWLSAGAEGLKLNRTERALARHQRFALRRISTMPTGLDGLQALARLVSAGAVLEGGATLCQRAQQRLDPLIDQLIDPEGGLQSRSPEMLAQAFCALAFAARALELSGQEASPKHRAALERTGAIIRALRLGDGTLARFHGGGGAISSELDAALMAARVRSVLGPEMPMGFARLSRGRSVVITDVAAPPLGIKGADGHASTLGFEMSAGRHPLIVNCGSGRSFGMDWHNAARSTASHSTLVVDQRSSTAIDKKSRRGQSAKDVQVDLHRDRPEAHLVGAHNGYADQYGLIHVRRLDLDLAGDTLRGEDLLSAVTEVEKRAFQKVSAGNGVAFALRFHLHPDVQADVDSAFSAVRLGLPGGGRWLFQHGGALTLRLDASVYLDDTRAEPRASRQIVLEGRARDFATTVRWSLSKEAGTPSFPRDRLRVQDPNDL